MQVHGRRGVECAPMDARHIDRLLGLCQTFLGGRLVSYSSAQQLYALVKTSGVRFPAAPKAAAVPAPGFGARGIGLGAPCQAVVDDILRIIMHAAATGV